MMEKFLSIPKNEKGKQDYIYGVEFNEDLELIQITQEEFDRIFPILQEINYQCDLMLDDSESETIPYEHLKAAIHIFEENSAEDTLFYGALNRAESYKTFLATDF